MNRVVEITLKKLTITNRGTLTGKEDINALSFCLSYPSAGKPSVTSVKEIKVKDKIPANFATQPYDEKVVFKELIQGDTQLTVDVVAIDNPGKLEKLLTGIFKGVLKAVFGAATKGISNVVTGAVIETASKSVFDAIEPTKSVQKIGYATLPIKDTQLTGQGELKMALKVPAKLVNTNVVLGAEEHEEQEVTVMEKGQLNGEVILSYKQLNQEDHAL